MTPTETKKRDIALLADMQEARDAIRLDGNIDGHGEQLMQTYALTGVAWKNVAAFHRARRYERDCAARDAQLADQAAKRALLRERRERRSLRKVFKLPAVADTPYIDQTWD